MLSSLSQVKNSFLFQDKGDKEGQNSVFSFINIKCLHKNSLKGKWNVCRSEMLTKLTRMHYGSNGSHSSVFLAGD
jgi:hypothetical protein